LLTGSALESRRAALLEAMVAVVSERGYARATVGVLCAQAGISRRSFYECFDSREECFLAVIDDGYRQVSTLIARAFERAKGDWREGLRGALAELLSLFDRRPELARVWLVECLAAGAWALERRARHIEALTEQIVGFWSELSGMGSHPLAAVGVMETLLGIVQTHALTTPSEPMVTLLGPLMGVVVAPYLDEQGVEVEIAVSAALAQELRAAPPINPPGLNPSPPPDPVLAPRAHRARTCLRYLASHPGASNRQVADAVGIKSHTQASALLARLQRAGLLIKTPAPPGGANAWTLTPHAQQTLDTHPTHTTHTGNHPLDP
jgi:AcrR family transcriptional regulator